MNILDQRASGILLHITSLPGPHGIGDFGPDAFHFVDWLASAGQKIWQWLPITPIGPANSPYQSVSAFAGSPLMVALEPLILQGWLRADQDFAPAFETHRVDFERVVPWRMMHLREAARGFSERASPDDRAKLKHWRASQAYWLDDYALFMALETTYAGQPWWQWPEALKRRDAGAIANARTQFAGEISFWEFVQWCFDQQREALREYAHQRGIAIMGDLPIFIAHHSADCWSRPDLYYLDDHFQPTVVAGVPPDDMGPLGQRWGNPLYRWDRMEAEDFGWWRARVHRSLEQADVIRIDHFRGFAGYWEIPATCPTAIEGRWVPAPGKALFAAIERALGKLPIVAEDLGLITPDVIELRDGCQFPGMRILQFGFGGDGAHEFLPHNYPHNTIVYTGTHDNDTARGWWDHAAERERVFAGVYLGAYQDDIHWAMIRAASNSVAQAAIFPMQDVLGLDTGHRMNLPGTVDGNWEWRFAWDMVRVENTRLLGLVAAASGRGNFSPLR